MKKHIPNIITLGNLFCGSLAVVNAIEGDLRLASGFILLGAFLDFFDGFAARMLGVSNELGKQLDSLADMVSFGLAPSLIAVQLMKGVLSMSDVSPVMYTVLSYVPFIIVLLSAMRLAKFNIDSRQSIDFIGMPTPANALFWLSIPLSMHYYPTGLVTQIFLDPWVIAIASVVLSILLVVELPIFSMKIKSFTIAGNEWKLILLLISIILLLILSVQAIPLIIIIYLLLSFIKNISSKSKT